MSKPRLRHEGGIGGHRGASGGMRGSCQVLSRQKFSSNVVERCLQLASPEEPRAAKKAQTGNLPVPVPAAPAQRTGRG